MRKNTVHKLEHGIITFGILTIMFWLFISLNYLWHCGGEQNQSSDLSRSQGSALGRSSGKVSLLVYSDIWYYVNFIFINFIFTGNRANRRRRYADPLQVHQPAFWWSDVFSWSSWGGIVEAVDLGRRLPQFKDNPGMGMDSQSMHWENTTISTTVLQNRLGQ